MASRPRAPPGRSLASGCTGRSGCRRLPGGRRTAAAAGSGGSGDAAATSAGDGSAERGRGLVRARDRGRTAVPREESGERPVPGAPHAGGLAAARAGRGARGRRGKMNCRQVERLLSAQRDRTLSASDARAAAGHLEICLRCRQRLQAFQRIATDLHELSDVAPAGACAQRALEQWRAEREVAPSPPRRRTLPAAVTISAAAICALLVFIAVAPKHSRPNPPVVAVIHPATGPAQSLVRGYAALPWRRESSIKANVLL